MKHRFTPGHIACILLIITSLIWGATFSLISKALPLITPADFVFWRFLIASLVLLPFCYQSLKFTTWPILVGCLLIGVANSGVFLFQTIGLETISASQTAFITGINVLMVPFLAPLFGLNRPRKKDLLLAGLCLAGLYILTGANLRSLQAGDAWVFACALCFAFALILIQKLTNQKVPQRLILFYQTVFTLPCVAIGLHHWTFPPASAPVWTALLYCAVLGTALAFYLQTRAQQHLTATQTAVIFTLEPVSAAFFAWWILGNPLTPALIIGGILIVLSVVWAD